MENKVDFKHGAFVYTDNTGKIQELKVRPAKYANDYLMLYDITQQPENWSISINKSVQNPKTKEWSRANATFIFNASEKALVTKAQLIAAGWNESTINDAMVADLNRVLEKYKINTPKRIRHFIAQCLHESSKGLYTFEQGSESYFANKDYGSKYRGVGYIQMTWKYSYRAFATYLALQAHPELSNYTTFRSPNNNYANAINREYTKLLNGAKTLGLNISTYTNIVDKGYTYVSDNFAWESAGYDWTIKQLNSLVDSGASVDDVSRKINRWDTATFPLRKALYDKIIEKGIFK